MPKELIFEELTAKERIVLLRAFDYDVDRDGYILSQSKEKIHSEENPSDFIHLDNVMLVSGSLQVMDGTPTAISKLIRKETKKDDTGTDS